MASVTFPVAVGGDGSTYTDDANASTGLANGGHRTRLVPMLAQVVAMAQNAAASATSANTSAASALAASGLSATSSTSITFSTGAKSLTIQTGKQFVVGQWVYLTDNADPANRWLHGTISAFTQATGAMTVQVVRFMGTGSASAWAVLPASPYYGTMNADALGNATITGSLSVAGRISGTIAAIDNRSTADAPASLYLQGMRLDFKTTAAAGTPGVAIGGGYAAVLSVHPWTDASGGSPVQLSFGDGLSIRAASGTTWGPWRTVWHSGNFDPTLKADLSSASFGALSVGGQAVWHAGNLTPGNYFPVSGGALTGELRLPSNQNLTFGAGYASGAATISGNNGTLNLYPGGSSSGATVQLTPTLASFTTPGQFATAVYIGAYQAWHAGNVDPFRFTGWISTPGADANTMPANRSSFTYGNNAPWTGPIARFDSSGYDLQLNADYINGNGISFRTRNGDAGAWNPWRAIWHAGNFNPASKADLSGGSIFQGAGSFNAFHIRSTDAANWSWFSMGSTGQGGPQAWHVAVNASASDGLGANALHLRPQAGAIGTALGIEADGTTRALKAFAAMATASFVGGTAGSNAGGAARVGLFDRAAGSFVVQLGGADNVRSFEVIDRDWTTSLLAVASNNFAFKGQTIWHAGNFNPANYLQTIGGTLTGAIASNVPDVAPILRSFNTSAGGAVQFFVQNNYADVNLGNWRGLLNIISQGVTSSASITAPQLAVNQGGGTTLTRLQIDSPAGQTGLLAAFTVAGASKAAIDANGWFSSVTGISADRIVAGFDSGVSGSVNASGWFRSSGASGWYNSTYGVGLWATDASMARVYGPAGTGLAVPGRIFGNAGTQGQSPAGNGLGTITVSTAAPSGGSQGDIWFQI